MADYFDLKGKLKWCRPYVADPMYHKYSTDLYPDAESLEVIRDLQTTKNGTVGIKNVLKKDEDGYCIRLSRPQERTFNGKVTGMGPILVYDGNSPLSDGSGYQELRNIMIGNGSDGICRVEYYTYTPKGQSRSSAIRWVSLRLDNLVPYSKGDNNLSETIASRGLVEVPRQKLLF